MLHSQQRAIRIETDATQKSQDTKILALKESISTHTEKKTPRHTRTIFSALSKPTEDQLPASISATCKILRFITVL